MTRDVVATLERLATDAFDDTQGIVALCGRTFAEPIVTAGYRAKLADVSKALQALDTKLAEVVDPFAMQIFKAQRRLDEATAFQQQAARIKYLSAIVKGNIEELSANFHLVMESTSAEQLKRVDDEIQVDRAESASALRAAVVASGQWAGRIEPHAGCGPERTPAPFSLEHRLIHPDGTERHVLHQAEAGRDLSHAIILRGNVQDITERKMRQGRIEYLANHDALTGLPNLNLLSDRTEQAMSHARRTGHLVAVMVLDLDRFKHINDTFGHSVGDGLLRAAAARLKASVRDGDTVARLGGDEFVVMLVNLSTAADADAVARKVLNTFVAPFVLDGHDLHVTTSIGVSVCPTDGADAETLLKMVDAALYCAKERGRNGYSFYTRELGACVEEQAELENALHEAVANGELELYYQPKVDLKTGQISGVEALIRWRRPGIGVIPPDRFIPIAEETGLILPIGEWVLRTTCAHAVAWRQDGHPPLRIAVNLSARQFRQQNMADVVRRTLRDTGLAPAWLELELTESVLMQDCNAIAHTLRELKALGVVLSLDEFGTGFSSLSYLKDLPIDVVKIDKSFLSDVTTSVEGASLTRSIIATAESLHMETVAEGVETEAQLSS